MTASETGREISADELVDRLRFRAGRYRAVIGNDIFYGRAEARDDEAAAAAAYWLGLNDGKSVDDREVARRARLRADQRAGEGGEA